MRHRILAIVALASATATPALADPVRMFAIGHKQLVSDNVTYQRFHDVMLARVARRSSASGRSHVMP